MYLKNYRAYVYRGKLDILYSIASDCQRYRYIPEIFLTLGWYIKYNMYNIEDFTGQLYGVGPLDCQYYTWKIWPKGGSGKLAINIT